jgi:tetratricopeptide (TPR) repeat protein
MLVSAISPLAIAEDLKEAQIHFEAGTKAYELGDYSQAINEYKLSYAAASMPSTLYALGQAFRARGELEAALHFYQQYVAKSPSGKYRAAAEQHMQNLEQLIEQKRVAQNTPPRDVPSPQEHRETRSDVQPKRTATAPAEPVNPPREAPAIVPWYRSSIGWGLSGSGLAVVIGGAGLLGASAARESDAATAASLDDHLRLADDASNFRAGGAAMIGIGGAAIVAGVVVFALEARKRPTLSARGPKVALEVQSLRR